MLISSTRKCYASHHIGTHSTDPQSKLYAIDIGVFHVYTHGVYLGQPQQVGSDVAVVGGGGRGRALRGGRFHRLGLLRLEAVWHMLYTGIVELVEGV